MAAPVLSHLRPWWLPFQLLPRIAARNRKNTPVPARGLTPWPDSKLPAFSHVPTASSTSLSHARHHPATIPSPFLSPSLSLFLQAKLQAMISPLPSLFLQARLQATSDLLSFPFPLSLSRPTPRLLGSQQATSPSFSRARLLRAPPMRASLGLRPPPASADPLSASYGCRGPLGLGLRLPPASADPPRPRTATEVPSAFVRLLQVPTPPRPRTAVEPPSASVPCFARKALSQLRSSQLPGSVPAQGSSRHSASSRLRPRCKLRLQRGGGRGQLLDVACIRLHPCSPSHLTRRRPKSKLTIPISLLTTFSLSLHS